MPKKKKGAKKKGKKAADSDPLSAENQVKRIQQEVNLLQLELAHRNEMARKNSFAVQEMKEQVLEKEATMEEQHQGKYEISSDLTRQYKTMQTQLLTKIGQLEKKCRGLEEKLEHTEKTLEDTRAESQKMLLEKSDLITQLTQRIQSMEGTYESILNEALDAMAGKVEAARDAWEIESYVVQQRNRERLMEFGLSHTNF